jgi:opacity protein-like surface antigen
MFSNGIENSISEVETNSLAAMVNAYYDFTQGDGFNPYVTVGLGFAQNDQKIAYYPTLI